MGQKGCIEKVGYITQKTKIYMRLVNKDGEEGHLCSVWKTNLDSIWKNAVWLELEI